MSCEPHFLHPLRATILITDALWYRIAGTSCVDYSGLNNKKQGIDANGESGRTFHGMLHYVNKHRPSFVLLENVANAPWDDVVVKWDSIGYHATFLRLDTK